MLQAPTSLICPEKVGEPQVLASKFGRQLRVQRYKHPDGKEDDYSHCHANAYPAITFPVTSDGLVVAQWEFRYGVNLPVLEISGGNRKEGETLEQVARTELTEETGYIPGKLILLNGQVFLDPATLTFWAAFFLAKDCVLGGERHLDPGEYVEPVTIPINEWIKMILRGEIHDCKTIAITFLALQHLGYRL